MSPPVRRALMTADAVGGVLTQTLDLLPGPVGEGVEVTLALLGPSASAERKLAAEAAGARVVETGLPLDWTAATAEEVRASAWSLAALARGLRADIVHLHSPAFAIADYPCPVVAALHSCTTTWWRAVEGSEPLPSDFRWRADLVAEGLARADVAYAPTRAFADAAESAYPAARLSVVRNGREPAPLAEGPRRSAFASGRWWDRAKGLDRLESVAARARTPIEIAGSLDGPGASARAAGGAIPLGHLSNGEVRERLARAQVYVSLARYEPFGLGVLEAAQAGCALLLSNISTFRDLWDGAATFVDGDDFEAAARALDRISEDTETSRRLGEGARARARDYTASAMRRDTLALWRAAATGARSAA